MFALLRLGFAQPAFERSKSVDSITSISDPQLAFSNHPSITMDVGAKEMIFRARQGNGNAQKLSAKHDVSFAECNRSRLVGKLGDKERESKAIFHFD